MFPVARYYYIGVWGFYSHGENMFFQTFLSQSVSSISHEIMLKINVLNTNLQFFYPWIEQSESFNPKKKVCIQYICVLVLKFKVDACSYV